jgi:hypothetical protein
MVVRLYELFSLFRLVEQRGGGSWIKRFRKPLYTD